jgi:hypothetical protein
MAHIYIRLGDPVFEEVFQDTFKEFIVEKNGHVIRIPIGRLLQILRDEQYKIWDEEVDEYLMSDNANLESCSEATGAETKAIE